MRSLATLCTLALLTFVAWIVGVSLGVLHDDTASRIARALLFPLDDPINDSPQNRDAILATAGACWGILVVATLVGAVGCAKLWLAARDRQVNDGSETIPGLHGWKR